MANSDLHTHTTYSDGSLSPGELVHLAAQMGIGEIAVTDHDTMLGWAEAEAAGRRFGVRVRPGVEISAFDGVRGHKVHILGYDIEDRNRLEDGCAPFLRSRHEAQMRALDLVAQAGYPITRNELLDYTGPAGTLYRQHIMHALADRGFTCSIYGKLYRKLFAQDGIAFVPSKYMDAFAAVRLVRECGGTAVLAHPLQYNSLELLPELVEAGLGGVEVWHSKHTSNDAAELQGLAHRHNLPCYGGSDFHGFYSERPTPLGSHRRG